MHVWNQLLQSESLLCEPFLCHWHWVPGQEHPEPFFDLSRQLFPGKFKPTLSHHFLRLLLEKDMLLRVYTQNIDTLERIAGIPGEKLVEAHGTFHSSHCLDCRAEYSLQWMRGRRRHSLSMPDSGLNWLRIADKIMSSDTSVPKCEKCGSTVKPDIVFFGERLPSRFFQLAEQDFEKCDLLIIIGTSLTVQPFAGLIESVSRETPRLLINKTKCGQASQIARLLGLGSGLEFDKEHNYRDVLILDECDNGCKSLAQALGWAQPLEDLMKAKDNEAKEAKEWLWATNGWQSHQIMPILLICYLFWMSLSVRIWIKFYCFN